MRHRMPVKINCCAGNEHLREVAAVRRRCGPSPMDRGPLGAPEGYGLSDTAITSSINRSAAGDRGWLFKLTTPGLLDGVAPV